jgi:low affinity Fe/Cu permease
MRYLSPGEACGLVWLSVHGRVMAIKTKPRSAKTRSRKMATAQGPLAAARANMVGKAASPGWFECFARATALLAGRPLTFFAAVAIVLVWAVTGPIFHFSDTWQLVINTGTTIVTFLMVFLIQQSQNRDTMAVQIKLAELIIAVENAHNALATAEDLSEQDLEKLHRQFAEKAERTLQRLQAKRGKAAVHEALKDATETEVSA